MYKTYLHEVNQINPVKFLLILNKFKKKKTATIFLKLNLFIILFGHFFALYFFIFLFLLISICCLTLSQLSFSMSRNTLMSSGMAREG